MAEGFWTFVDCSNLGRHTRRQTFGWRDWCPIQPPAEGRKSASPQPEPVPDSPLLREVYWDARLLRLALEVYEFAALTWRQGEGLP